MYYSPKEVAVALGVSYSTVFKWLKDGLLKSFSFPGSNRKLVPKTEVTSFATEHGVPFNQDSLQKIPRKQRTVA